MTPLIRIDAPTSDARRDRIERDVLERVATLRAADRSDAFVMPAPRWRKRIAIGALIAVGAAAAIVVFVTRPRGESPADVAIEPSLVVTPAGGASRFTVADAVIDAGSDTSVEVRKSDDGGATLALARGSVDCDVAPRAGRPPFRVIAGDVTVEVVGTRFSVARTPAVRVDVTRGKVRVIAHGTTTYVAAGESWPRQDPADHVDHAPPATAPAVPQPIDDVAPAQPETSHSPDRAKPTPREAFEAAHALAATDPVRAARAYRAVANGSDTYAALALFDLAELHATSGKADAAVQAFDEYGRRFPRADNAEDAAWRPIEILRAAGRRDDAVRAAKAYLRAFPRGVYATTAGRLAKP